MSPSLLVRHPAAALVAAALASLLLAGCSSTADRSAKPLVVPKGPPPKTARKAPDPSGRFWLSAEDIVRMRRNVLHERWARVAWLENDRLVMEALASRPKPAAPNGSYREPGDRSCPPGGGGWYCGLYKPGLRDGRYAYSLALAYAVTGKERYAAAAKRYLLAWAREYDPAPPTTEIGHMIAEPVGFMLKAFFAYDLTRDTFTDSERRVFQDWAAQFVERGRREADSAMDHPWVPEAPWGNSATWARSLAVTAAAVVGGETLRETLDWNWQHATPDGQDYGWIRLLKGVMEPSGHMIEEDVRDSVDYALYTWHPLAIIATIAEVTGYKHDLWTAEAPTGQSLRKPIEYYAPYLTKQERDPYSYDQDHLDAMLGEYRTAMETAGRRFPHWDLLQEVLSYGGPDQRGANEDSHITGWNALTGSG